MKINIEKLKNVKMYFFILFAVGILLLAISSFPAKKDEKEKVPQTFADSFSSERAQIQKKLKNTVEKISGVSDVTVLITYENTGVKKAETNVSSAVSSSDGAKNITEEKSAVMKKASSVEEPFICEEILPEVRGVMIVARGVGNSGVNVQITEAVSAVLDVPIHKVKVLSAD